MSKTFKPPKSAINNAKKGLDFRKKYGRGGLTPAEAKSYGIDSGITRAKRIASGKLSKHDVRRMSAFNRHRGNYNPSKKMADGGPTAGTIAWLLWGGTSGVNWAKKQSAALGAEESFTDDEKDRVRERLIRLSKPASDSFIEGYLTAKKDLEQRKNSSKKQAESFGAEIFESQGTLKFSNREIIQLLFNNNWKCRNCDNIIKNKQNIPFSEEERKDITWAMLAKEYDLTNYDDINVVRKKTRGSKGNLARIDGHIRRNRT